METDGAPGTRAARSPAWAGIVLAVLDSIGAALDSRTRPIFPTGEAGTPGLAPFTLAEVAPLVRGQAVSRARRKMAGTRALRAVRRHPGERASDTAARVGCGTSAVRVARRILRVTPWLVPHITRDGFPLWLAGQLAGRIQSGEIITEAQTAAAWLALCGLDPAGRPVDDTGRAA